MSVLFALRLWDATTAWLEFPLARMPPADQRLRAEDTAGAVHLGLEVEFELTRLQRIPQFALDGGPPFDFGLYIFLGLLGIQNLPRWRNFNLFAAAVARRRLLRRRLPVAVSDKELYFGEGRMACSYFLEKMRNRETRVLITIIV